MLTPPGERTKLHRTHLMLAMLLAAILVLGARGLSQQFRAKAAPPTPLSQQSAPATRTTSSADTSTASPSPTAARQHEQALLKSARLRREQKLQEALEARAQNAEIARLDQEHKEQAWKRFYKQPAKCRHPLSEQVSLNCNKQKETERLRFEVLWDEGKIDGR